MCALDGQSGGRAREGETLGKKGVVIARAEDPLVKGVVIPRAKPLVQGVVIPRAKPLVKGVVMHTATKATTSPQSLGGAYQATRLPKHPA